MRKTENIRKKNGILSEVLVMVDNVPLGGSVEQILLGINPDIVESIEFTNRINVLYGSQGASGVISIYTKQASNENYVAKSNFQKILLTGYSFNNSFKFPDYLKSEIDKSIADYRSTIYWNPDVVPDSGKETTVISLFASDLAGKYRIAMEGVTSKGVTVSCVYFIVVAE